MGAAVLIVLSIVAPACRTTVDSLGSHSDAGAKTMLRPLTRRASYPNAFRDVLHKTDSEIASKIAAAFAQLFHGDPTSEAIYVAVGADQAYVRDILHDDVRTEGIGYAMMIAVQLDKRDEFDRLWRYATTTLMYASGPNQGYFRSVCDVTATDTVACIDPFGLQQFLMALIFAHDRWSSTSGAIDYQTDALALLTTMRDKERLNGGIIDGVTNTFDATSKLVFDFPSSSTGMQTRIANEMPGYYGLWAEATGDPFWSQAAAAGRTLWKAAAHPVTGLMPVRVAFDATPVVGSENFRPDVYRAQLNMVLDDIWFGTEPWEVEESNKLLQFFAGRGIATYGSAFSLDGATTVDVTHAASLVAANGMSALIATNSQAAAFVGAVWDLPTPTGPVRYYSGLLDLLALLVLSGQFQVY